MKNLDVLFDPGYLETIASMTESHAAQYGKLRMGVYARIESEAKGSLRAIALDGIY